MSEEERPARVRVTGPDRRSRPSPRAGDIDEETPLGTVFIDSLLSEQLALALRILATLAVTVGSLPFVFHLVPDVADVRLLGLPLAWLLLGVLIYPWLMVLGWRYVRRAEANERDFVELLEDRDP